jgi:cytochrome c-type biogenesis protein
VFEIGGVSIFLAFAAGLLSVLSPCVLPLIPAYLGYLTGVSLEAAPERVPLVVSSTSGGAAVTLGGPSPVPLGQAPSPFLHSLAFVSGFTLIFVLFGIAVGIIGYFLRDNQDLILKVSGTLLIVMGLHLAGVITIPFLDQERRLDAGRNARIGYARSFVVGSAFAAGWSPCIGPTLGAIFALSVASGTVAQGALLLLVYSAGLAVPFLLMGFAYGAVKPFYTRAKRYVWIVNYLAGAMLIVVGILIFTDSLINMNNYFNFGLLQDVSGNR